MASSTGFVKWSDRPVAAALLDDLRERVSDCEALRRLTVTPAVISRSGFRGNADGHLIDLSTLDPIDLSTLG